MSDLTYKVLNTDGTITVYDKAAEIDSQLADIKNYIDTPVATYTHTTNKEVVVSAVDVDTDTFTSVGHGLINGNLVNPILNLNAGLVYPYAVYAGGLTFLDAASYFVVNKTDDTFQLSLTSGGDAINLVTNATIDLTKWHFEVPTPTVTISSIPSTQKLRVRFDGKTLRKNNTGYCVPNGVAAGLSEWFKTGETAITSAYLSIYGDIKVVNDISINYTGYLTIKEYMYLIYSNTASAVLSAITERAMYCPAKSNGNITALEFTNTYFANGTKIEVYND